MEVAEVAVETLMLALFRSDTPAYQPVHPRQLLKWKTATRRRPSKT